MKRYIIYFSLLGVIVSAFAYSCAKTDDDTTPPVIRAVSLSPNDTIKLDSGEIIEINTDDEAVLNTLVLGRKLKFKAEFSDNKMLSFYRILINVDPENHGIEKDSAYSVSRRWVDIFGQTEYNFPIRYNDDILIPDKFDHTEIDPVTGESVAQQRPVREGLYNLEVILVDAAGNSTSVNQSVVLKKRSTIVDDHSK